MRGGDASETGRGVEKRQLCLRDEKRMFPEFGNYKNLIFFQSVLKKL